MNTLTKTNSVPSGIRSRKEAIPGLLNIIIAVVASGTALVLLWTASRTTSWLLLLSAAIAFS